MRRPADLLLLLLLPWLWLIEAGCLYRPCERGDLRVLPEFAIRQLSMRQQRKVTEIRRAVSSRTRALLTQMRDEVKQVSS